MVSAAINAAASKTKTRNLKSCLFQQPARYVWLSQIRHSAFQSVIHDITATKLDGSDQYAVMACPNFTEEDMPVKQGVMFGALADLRGLVSDFARAIGYPADESNPFFDDRLKLSGEILSELVRSHKSEVNPISLQGTWFLKKYPPVKKS